VGDFEKNEKLLACRKISPSCRYLIAALSLYILFIVIREMMMMMIIIIVIISLGFHQNPTAERQVEETFSFL
jgi:hypothetical protein